MTDNALMQYGRQGEVVELVSRLMKLHPQANEVGEQGMMIVAQTAILLGANPLPGANELHVWKDNKGKTCFQLGINFLRRKAMEWGGVLFQVRPRQMTDGERREYGIAQGGLAAICIGVRVDDMEKWHGLGFGASAIWDMCGRVGVGTATQTEYPKNGRPAIWTVFLRAERDMMRQLFPHQMKSVEQSVPTGDTEPAQWAEWNEQVFEAGQDDDPVIAGQFTDKSDDDLSDDLFGVATPPVTRHPAPLPPVREVPAGVDRETGEVLTVGQAAEASWEDLGNVESPVTIDPAKGELFRGKVQDNRRSTVGSVASAATMTGAYRSDAHALNAAKVISADLEKNTQLTKEDALRLFDRLIDRKRQPQQATLLEPADVTGYAE
jgi:hypothetical protein